MSNNTLEKVLNGDLRDSSEYEEVVLAEQEGTLNDWA